jgi:predicted GNAT superfamily acetyltransferase
MELYGFNEVEPGRAFDKEFKGGRLRFSRLTKAPEIEPRLELLNRIWGFTEPEQIPLHEAVVCVMTGGLFLSIDLDRKPAGLVYVMPAHTREWGYHHHSNFMGFLPEYRSMGMGLEAKRVHAILARRETVDLVTWTFDPLQTANANLNFRKLGCVCRTYLTDLYGSMGGTFDPGLPTDRFLVEWRLDAERVRHRLRGDMPSAEELADRFEAAPVFSVSESGAGVACLDSEDSPPALRVAIPEGVPMVSGGDKGSARDTVIKFRGLFQKLFGSGYKVTEMIRAGAKDDRHYYVLEKEAGF